MYKDQSILTKSDFLKYLKGQDSCIIVFLERVSDTAFDKEKNQQVCILWVNWINLST